MQPLPRSATTTLGAMEPWRSRARVAVEVMVVGSRGDGIAVGVKGKRERRVRYIRWAREDGQKSYLGHHMYTMSMRD